MKLFLVIVLTLLLQESLFVAGRPSDLVIEDDPAPISESQEQPVNPADEINARKVEARNGEGGTPDPGDFLGSVGGVSGMFAVLFNGFDDALQNMGMDGAEMQSLSMDYDPNQNPAVIVDPKFSVPANTGDGGN